MSSRDAWPSIQNRNQHNGCCRPYCHPTGTNMPIQTLIQSRAFSLTVRFFLIQTDIPPVSPRSCRRPAPDPGACFCRRQWWRRRGRGSRLHFHSQLREWDVRLNQCIISSRFSLPPIPTAIPTKPTTSGGRRRQRPSPWAPAPHHHAWQGTAQFRLLVREFGRQRALVCVCNVFGRCVSWKDDSQRSMHLQQAGNNPR